MKKGNISFLLWLKLSKYLKYSELFPPDAVDKSFKIYDNKLFQTSKSRKLNVRP